MVTQISPDDKSKVIYPESDGKPMADNTVQFRWIVTIQGGLDDLFRDRPDVFVAGDLFWYPVEGDNTIRCAPDALIVFGRPKGDRGSYMQWQEDNIAPQVVFEVLSPGNRLTEMAKKLSFYDRYGVEEYYLFDPNAMELTGWLRSEGRLEVIDQIEAWVSPRLGVRFELASGELEIYRPDEQKFLTYIGLSQQLERERQAKELAQFKAQRLAERLQSLGINPDEV